jgi:hypothetical protein
VRFVCRSTPRAASPRPGTCDPVASII